MIPNVVTGGDMVGLLRYLSGPGKANEHDTPHVVSGDDFLMSWFGSEELNRAGADEISAYLERPRQLYGTTVRKQVKALDAETGRASVAGYTDAHVWHCSLSLRADEGPLGDERWNAIARDFADQMGFTEVSGKAPIRWVAIHHGVSTNGNDHIHIAATMVREDGTRWDGRFNDYKTAQFAARAIEAKHGLATVAGREFGTAVRGEKPAERANAQRAGLGQTAPKELAERVRSAAVASSSEAEWVRRVRDALVVIKPRFAAGGTDVVTGYSVALKPADYNDKLVFYGGSQLGKDLRLGSIRRMWAEPTVGEATAAAGEWQAAFRGQPPVVRDGRETGDVSRVNVDRVVGRLTGYADRLASVPHWDRESWATAARDTSGALSAWARFDPANAGDLRSAAGALSRSANPPRAGQPAASTTSGRSGLAGVALLFAQATRQGRGKDAVAAALFLRQLLRLVESVRAHQVAVANLAEVTRIERDVIDRLERIPLTGYATPTAKQLAVEAGDTPAVEAMTVAQAGQPPTTDPARAEEQRPAVSDPLPRRLTPAQQRALRDTGRER